MAEEKVWFEPGPNSWAREGSAGRTKVELLPYLQPWLTGAATGATTAKPKTILEVASGFGEHSAYYAENTPATTFQPTEAQEPCIDGIAKLAAEAPHKNILPPLKLNVLSSPQWKVVADESGPFDGVFVMNMLHISPWESTVKFFEESGKLLKGTPGAFVAVYGAFKRDGKFTGEGDRLFDLDLKRRDERWGIRDLESEVVPEAKKSGFALKELHSMNYNNWFIVWTIE
ncbi:hypothetical protein V1512DRAFT_228473 [Lipomyces arxii]|uniref:uncharacterized protein n=1 Tax=Lipomyces arxii TaxID=56418 RepID=UPI0034CD797E